MRNASRLSLNLLVFSFSFVTLCGTGSAEQPSVAETVLRNFAGPLKGSGPQASLVRDSAGNLYGTATSGGNKNAGVVFRLTPSGSQTVLHSFGSGTDGAYPYAGVVLDTAGNLYGTTQSGGTSDLGVVYKITAEGQETVLHNFAGVVYEITSAGVETILYSFTGGADGGFPYSGVIQDAAGNLYGTTSPLRSPLAAVYSDLLRGAW